MQVIDLKTGKIVVDGSPEEVSREVISIYGKRARARQVRDMKRYLAEHPELTAKPHMIAFNLSKQGAKFHNAKSI